MGEAQSRMWEGSGSIDGGGVWSARERGGGKGEGGLQDRRTEGDLGPGWCAPGSGPKS